MSLADETGQVADITRTMLQTKILEALKETPEYIESLVKAALEQEVDEHGTKPDYRSSDRMPYLEYLTRSAIRRLAADTIHEWLKTNSDQVVKLVHEELSKLDIAEAFTKAIIGTVDKDWKINIEFQRERNT